MSQEMQNLTQQHALQINRPLNTIDICLKNLHGSISFTDLIAFDRQPLQPTPVTLLQKMEGLHIDDPRSHLTDIRVLGRIHQTVVESTEFLCKEEEKLQSRYWLATLFHHFLSRYDLFQEGYGCRQAWAHLLKLRYHSLVGLHFYREEEALTQGEQQEFLRAFRDWRDFCTDERNHFLFRSSQRLGSPERELNAIVFGERDERNRPLPLFLKHNESGRLLDQLLADWFLRDRYDWFRALYLAWHRHRQLIMAGGTSLIVIATIPMIVRWNELADWKTFALSILLSLTYAFLPIAWIMGIFQRTVMDLLLPRVWAGVIVGYLPLFITGEVWKLAYDSEWWWRKPVGLTVLNVLALLLAFGYLRWEVGNRLARTPEMCKWTPICRSLGLTLYGWLVSVVSGLMLFSIAGMSMARASLLNSLDSKNDTLDKICACGTPGLFGNIHLSALFLFAPFALLIGVIVQLFWEEKSITHHA